MSECIPFLVAAAGEDGTTKGLVDALATEVGLVAALASLVTAGYVLVGDTT